MTELSPATQAVLDAVLPVYDDEYLYIAPMEKHAGMIAAAAIRTVADHCINKRWSVEMHDLYTQLYSIATELENQ